MAVKLTRLTSEDSDATAPSGRKLYYLLFSVLVASLGPFGYAFLQGER
jgi:hypothetical protein